MEVIAVNVSSSTEVLTNVLLTGAADQFGCVRRCDPGYFLEESLADRFYDTRNLRPVSEDGSVNFRRQLNSQTGPGLVNSKGKS